MADYIKIVVVPFGQPISTGIAKEVLPIDSSLIDSGRRAYAIAGVNVITQAATVREHLDYSHGLTISPNEDNRTVAESAGTPGKWMINELQNERFGF